MRRKHIAFWSIIGVLLLSIICVFVIAFGTVFGWWLWDQDSDSQLIRIVSLAPLMASRTDQTVDEPLSVAVEPQAETPAEVTESNILASPEQAEMARGFAIPDGAVDSVTQAGLANRLVIPKLNVDSPIVLSPIENQTWKVDHLGQDKVGHLEGTAPAGSGSNMVVAAHVTVSAGVYGPFAGLAQLEPGDEVIVYDEGRQYRYIVDGYQLVDRTAVEVTNPTDRGQITLITCSNWDHNEQRYVERLIVTGHLSGS